MVIENERFLPKDPVDNEKGKHFYVESHDPFIQQ